MEVPAGTGSTGKRLLDGEPIAALTREATEGDYGLLVLGCRPLSGLRAWRSRDLPGKLSAAVRTLPVLLVPAETSTGTPSPPAG